MSNATIAGVTDVILWAGDVSATYPVEEVWAVIIPPGFTVDPKRRNRSLMWPRSN